MLSFYLQILQDPEADGEAFRALYERYEGLVFGISRKIVRNHHAAEEAAQETWIKVAVHFHRIVDGKGEDDIGRQLSVIARNTAIDKYRKRKRQWKKETLSAETIEKARAARKMGMEDSAYLRWLIRELEEPYRSALEMQVVLGLSYREIAGRLGVTEAAVNNYVHRGKKQLRTLMEEQEAENRDGCTIR